MTCVSVLVARVFLCASVYCITCFFNCSFSPMIIRPLSEREKYSCSENSMGTPSEQATTILAMSAIDRFVRWAERWRVQPLQCRRIRDENSFCDSLLDGATATVPRAAISVKHVLHNFTTLVQFSLLITPVLQYNSVSDLHHPRYSC